MNNNYLEHHGILGQKWGVRRFQNKDGSLTSAGKKRQAENGWDKLKEKATDRKIAKAKADNAKLKAQLKQKKELAKYKNANEDLKNQLKGKTPKADVKDAPKKEAPKSTEDKSTSSLREQNDHQRAVNEQIRLQREYANLTAKEKSKVGSFIGEVANKAAKDVATNALKATGTYFVNKQLKKYGITEIKLDKEKDD